MPHLLTALVIVMLHPFAPSDRSSLDDQIKAELLGKLVYTTVDVYADGADARDVLDALSDAIVAPIIGRYIDDRHDTGIDPHAPIFLQASDESALDVLEMVLEQCTVYLPSTWQLRKGFIEVGTKDRLGPPAAAETRTYNIRDLMIDAPSFPAPDNPITGNGGATSIGQMVRDFENHPYRAASLSRPNIGLTRASVPGVGQVSPQELALQIVQGIVEVIEPGNWDWGQYEEEDFEKAVQRDAGRTQSPSRQRPAYRPPARIGTIRIWRDVIVINAPDFMQRQVGGYPDPVPPPAIDDTERARRNAKALRENVVITVRAVGADRGVAGDSFRAARSLPEDGSL